jgi:hypothetical protein
MNRCQAGAKRAFQGQSPSNVHRYRVTGIRNRNPGARIYGQVQVLTLTAAI